MPSMLVRSGVISPGRGETWYIVVGSLVLVVEETGPLWWELVVQPSGKIEDLARQQGWSGSIQPLQSVT